MLLDADDEVTISQMEEAEEAAEQGGSIVARDSEDTLEMIPLENEEEEEEGEGKVVEMETEGKPAEALEKHSKLL